MAEDNIHMKHSKLFLIKIVAEMKMFRLETISIVNSWQSSKNGVFYLED